MFELTPHVFFNFQTTVFGEPTLDGIQLSIYPRGERRAELLTVGYRPRVPVAERISWTFYLEGEARLSTSRKIDREAISIALEQTLPIDPLALEIETSYAVDLLDWVEEWLCSTYTKYRKTTEPSAGALYGALNNEAAVRLQQRRNELLQPR